MALEYMPSCSVSLPKTPKVADFDPIVWAATSANPDICNFSHAQDRIVSLEQKLCDLESIIDCVKSDINSICPFGPHLSSCDLIGPFSGKDDENFLSWLRDFELLATAQQWDDSCKCRKLPLLLHGSARSIFYDLSNTECTPYSSLVSALKTKLVRPDSRISSVNALLCKTQAPSERVVEYSAGFRELVRFAYPNTNLQQLDPMLRDLFIKGLLPQYHESLFLDPPSTLSKAIDKACKIETAQLCANLLSTENSESHANFEPEPSSPPVVFTAAQTSTLQQSISNKVRTASKSPPPKFDPKFSNLPHWTADFRPVCDFCGFIGHVKRACRKRRAFSASNCPKIPNHTSNFSVPSFSDFRLPHFNSVPLFCILALLCFSCLPVANADLSKSPHLPKISPSNSHLSSLFCQQGRGEEQFCQPVRTDRSSAHAQRSRRLMVKTTSLPDFWFPCSVGGTGTAPAKWEGVAARSRLEYKFYFCSFSVTLFVSNFYEVLSDFTNSSVSV